MFVVKPTLTTIIAMLIVTPIFIQTFGSTLFVPLGSTDEKAQMFSRTLYAAATLIGQLTYTLVTSVYGSFVILPVFEAREISQAIYAANGGMPGIINTLACLFSACVITAGLAFLLRIPVLSRLFQHVPLSLITVLMLKSGTEQTLFGCLYYYNTDGVYAYVRMAIALAITQVALVLLKRTREPLFLLGYIGLLTAVANVLCWATGREEFLGCALFQPRPAALSVSDAVHNVNITVFRPLAVLENWRLVMSLATYPFIPMCQNLPAYAQMTGATYDFQQEMNAFSFANICAAVAMYPVYFNCSGSAMLYLCGGRSRRYAFLAGMACIPLWFIFPHIAALLPVFVLTLITQFIGVSFLVEYARPFFRSRLVDQAMVAFCLVAAVSGLFSVPVTALVVYACECLHAAACAGQLPFVSAQLRAFKRGEGEAATDGVAVDGLLTFYNCGALLAALGELNGAVTVDLTDCAYIDMHANWELHDLGERLVAAGHTLTIIGKPKNMYSHLYTNVGKELVFKAHTAGHAIVE